ncbi:hypothetical protein Tco_0039773 [Tanacetum coccineum]
MPNTSNKETPFNLAYDIKAVIPAEIESTGNAPDKSGDVIFGFVLGIGVLGNVSCVVFRILGGSCFDWLLLLSWGELLLFTEWLGDSRCIFDFFRRWGYRRAFDICAHSCGCVGAVWDQRLFRRLGLFGQVLGKGFGNKGHLRITTPSKRSGGTGKPEHNARNQDNVTPRRSMMGRRTT